MAKGRSQRYVNRSNRVAGSYWYLFEGCGKYRCNKKTPILIYELTSSPFLSEVRSPYLNPSLLTQIMGLEPRLALMNIPFEALRKLGYSALANQKLAR